MTPLFSMTPVLPERQAVLCLRRDNAAIVTTCQVSKLSRSLYLAPVNMSVNMSNLKVETLYTFQ